MDILFHFMFLVTIWHVRCQQMLNEELAISTQKPGERINIKKTNIARRFIEDLDDNEWHVAHLRGAVMDGRKDCMSETFEDKARRYFKMLSEDGARVSYVSANPLPVKPEDLVKDLCEVNDDLSDNFDNVTMKITSGNFIDRTTVAQSVTPAVTVDSMKVANTTPNLDFKATTVESKVKPKSEMKKLGDKAENDTIVRRASEYMFSSVEYYDETIEFNAQICPDDVEVIELNIDQLRNYDLECEMIIEWRSLD